VSSIRAESAGNFHYEKDLGVSRPLPVCQLRRLPPAPTLGPRALVARGPSLSLLGPPATWQPPSRPLAKLSSPLAAALAPRTSPRLPRLQRRSSGPRTPGAKSESDPGPPRPASACRRRRSRGGWIRSVGAAAGSIHTVGHRGCGPASMDARAI
jgi:hypothetical protein